ncbi:MFS transporter [Yinghuangia aomiensis]
MTNSSLHPDTRSSAAPQLDPRRWIVLAILAGSLLLIAMDTTILNVAFPSLVEDLQPGSVQQLWIIDAYALALSGLLVTAGALGDRWGRKRLLMIGFGIFAAASLGAAFATEPWHVIAARALLGVGGAAIMPSTLSLLRSVFTDARERGLAYAIWAAVFGGGMALGPVVGGLLVEHQGWQSAFLLNIPVALAVVGFGMWFIPESHGPRAGNLGLVGRRPVDRRHDRPRGRHQGAGQERRHRPDAVGPAGDRRGHAHRVRAPPAPHRAPAAPGAGCSPTGRSASPRRRSS